LCRTAFYHIVQVGDSDSAPADVKQQADISFLQRADM
jgi:hypothetical protein